MPKLLQLLHLTNINQTRVKFPVIRPVSILNTFSKIYERVVKDQQEVRLEK